ncbi:unnamed protein product [Adineta steineri]|uniref:RING-type domain-containing protein n=1 Tax=Adineta steineri TaxID=433720 RepID=A0A814GLN0_9BILA|nr:unnamed protein product [Adineta steineri]CAF1069370.1 unnamed protein product [Adineta steineri]CAF3623862.1 unnamed protein product [Adineta steineri]CAF3813954.1 unnamed protein product [Adineta steineri]
MNKTKSFLHGKPIPWRIIDPGLCLEGRCVAHDRLCKAHNQMVIGNLQMGQFTISSMHTFKCPECGSTVRALKYAFNRCQWRIMNTSRWFNIGDIYETSNLSQLPLHIETRSVDITSKSKVIEDCTICLSSMEEENKCSLLPCKHVFHTECIHGWIDSDEERSLECPNCRKPIFE